MLTSGALLKSERKKKKLTLEEVSAATKINQTYLEAIEQDDYDKFPSTVYAKGFLQSYAKYLDLNVDRVIALYRRSIGETPPAEVQQTQKPLKQTRFILTPGIIIITFVVIIVLATFAYLIYQFYNFQKPPLLNITSPGVNTTVETSETKIVGTTEPGMFVTINDEPVKVSQSGTFETIVALSRGTNSIIVKARHPDNIGKEAVVTLTIESDPPEEVAEDEEPDKEEEKKDALTEFTLDLAIGGENAWIEVEVDGQQVFASVAPAQSSYSYTAEKTIYVRTGKASSTTISIDGESYDLFTEGGGVASVLCELKENTIDCHQP